MRKILLVTLLVIAAACGDGGNVQETADREPAAAAEPSPTAGCAGARVAPGEYEGLNTVGDVEQPYWVVVPEAYDEIAPAPLYLHLASGTGDHQSFLAGWRPYYEGLPGLMAVVNTEGPRRRDPEVLLGLVEQMSAGYCIDRDRIHVLGTSSSGAAAARLACAAAGRVASFTSGLSDYVPATSCTPERAVPLLTFTGDDDRLWVADLASRWAEMNGCDADPAIESLGSGVVRKRYRGCDADVVLYDIEGMGHVWPMHEAKGPGAPYVAEYTEVDYLEEALAFFAEHPLP